MWQRVRHCLAANLLDAPRYSLVLQFPRLARLLGRSWTDLCNRGERLLRRPDQRGVAFDWRWSSALYFCQAYPRVGGQLLNRVQSDWPIRFRSEPENSQVNLPQVSFVIGHRGQDRLPHLLTTLKSIAGQAACSVECIVVEQSERSELVGVLPHWVRHVQTPLPYHGMPYSRSWAFNVGSRLARAEILILHDNDLIVPADYAREVCELLSDRFEVARLQRFIFYLNEADSRRVFVDSDLSSAVLPEAVIQNNHGGTLALRKSVYFELGGYDEAFVGWGGEDNEMFDRCRTRRLHDHAYLPFVHLHHAPQPGKRAVHPNSAYFEARVRIPSRDRIADLRWRNFGSFRSPANLDVEEACHDNENLGDSAGISR